jgi:hypothetical protein
MESLEKFKKFKLDLKLNVTFGGSAREENVQTLDGKCGDTKKTWYNEDNTICCTETKHLCCDPV